MVTHYAAEATPAGIKGSIEFNDRFVFACLYGKLPFFVDKKYDFTKALTPDVKVNDPLFEQWMRATNLLTMDKARQVAESALKSAGVPKDKMGFDGPLEKKQEKHEWTDGKIYPLPWTC